MLHFVGDLYSLDRRQVARRSEELLNLFGLSEAADHTTDSMKKALAEVGRRREYQLAMNKKYGITPTSIKKPLREKIVEELAEEKKWDPLAKETSYQKLPHLDLDSLTPMDKKRLVKNLRREMYLAAQDLNFELATEIRDKLQEMRG